MHMVFLSGFVSAIAFVCLLAFGWAVEELWFTGTLALVAFAFGILGDIAISKTECLTLKKLDQDKLREHLRMLGVEVRESRQL
jgi:hypothetical protein